MRRRKVSGYVEARSDERTDLDGELSDAERVEHLAGDGEDLGVGKHRVVSSSNVKILR